MMRAFAGLARSVTAVPVPGQAAGLDPERLAGLAREAGLAAEVSAHVPGAVEAILSRLDAKEPQPRIVICGSLYLAGAVLAANG